MILHAVFLKLRPQAAAGELADVMTGLAALIDQIDGFAAFAHGPNRDVEGLSPGFGYGFQCTFEDLDALGRYADDPRHRALGARLVALCEPGGLMVFDIDTNAGPE